MIDSYGIGKQILIASPRQDDCKSLKALAKNVRTMLWIGGTASEIQEKFQQAAASGFNGLDQVQLHLNDKKEAQGWRYELEPEILKAALQQTQKSGRDLEVFVKQFDEPTIHALLDMGIRWFATDEPQRFVNTIATWKK
jgi:glycerophosphoryl diester phosphodiesterase